MASVFLCEKYTHLLCLSVGDTEREAPKAFSPVSRGKPYLTNAAMTMQIYASQALVRCLSYWLALSLSDLHTKYIFLKYIHKCSPEAEFFFACQQRASGNDQSLSPLCPNVLRDKFVF